MRTFNQFIKELSKKYGYKECPKCNGKGKVKRFPYYATIMPEMTDIDCEDCNGRGSVFVVPDDTRIVRESNY